MRTLLVDIGNSRIKWAHLEGEHLHGQKAAAYDRWTPGDFARRTIQARGLERILVASVASDEINRWLTVAAQLADAPKPQFVQTLRRAGGITVGYHEPWRLGVDRFVAAIGARHLFAEQALVVIGVGTAMTVDLVNAAGRHLGGAIIPAPGLMIESLLEKTEGIRSRATGGEAGHGKGLFGRSTRAGIVQGSRYAAAATIERAIQEAEKRVKQRPLAVLTGGGAADVHPLVRTPSRLVDNLVLQGLSVLAGAPRAHAGKGQ